ncbi:hypothetical protein AV530_000824 [Patagioenas fasciata monilis]|uniref:Uncharacterized protein n=1 Tax=Patagioenas fasciata monilis TaxID=372326 RepID=A0A1V4KSC0_PATFA|nr:hypothetical protein AV530_000824 [Patagioenas fasciata monilis]
MNWSSAVLEGNDPASVPQPGGGLKAGLMKSLLGWVWGHLLCQILQKPSELNRAHRFPLESDRGSMTTAPWQDVPPHGVNPIESCVAGIRTLWRCRMSVQESQC